MAGLKGNSITAFNAGEMTPEFAGRIDKDESKFTFRYSSNFLPTCQGGLKKFYGTYLSDYLPVNVGTTEVRLIPFNGSVMPIAVALFGGDVYSVSPSGVYKMGFNISPQVAVSLSYKQVNDVIYCASEYTAPFSIVFIGFREDVPTFVYRSSGITVEPFFPVGWDGNFSGKIIASAYSGDNVTFTASRDGLKYYSLELPEKLKTVSVSTGILSRVISNAVIQTGSVSGPIVIGSSRLKLIRKRTNSSTGVVTESEVFSVNIGNETDVKVTY